MLTDLHVPDLYLLEENLRDRKFPSFPTDLPFPTARHPRCHLDTNTYEPCFPWLQQLPLKMDIFYQSVHDLLGSTDLLGNILSQCQVWTMGPWESQCACVWGSDQPEDQGQTHG